MRNESSQRQRTQNNPLNLGSFSQTSLRYLKGNLGPVSKLIGRADTNSSSNGGFGGGTYNHWYKVTLLSSAWIITVKGPPRPQYIQVSMYNLDKNPIEGRGIFDKDSISLRTNGKTYYPYVGHTMNAQSDLYNTFDPDLLDKGDERYFILPAGSYLFCVSTTRNEPLNYELGLIIEFENLELNYLLESGGGDYLVFESATSPTTLLDPVNYIYMDIPLAYTGEQEHQHSLGEWRNAWDREHQQDDRFPDIFKALATTL